MNGWIKLHRKLLDNQIWKHDPTAWRVFEYLLLTVDHRTGSWDTGRFVIAESLDMKPSTVYKSLKRLEKAEMVTLTSNNKYSTISICKWKEYQQDDNNTGNNKVTTKEQQSNTKQEGKKVRSKEERESLYTHLKITKEEYGELISKFPYKDVKGECDKANDWLPNSTKRYKDFPAFMRNWLRKVPDTKHKPNIFVPPVPINKDGLSKFKSMKESFNLNKGTL